MSIFIAYLVLAVTGIINIVVPISGSSTVTPMLALLTDPHTAIALASVFFFIGAVVRVVMFREFIRFEYVRKMWWTSALAAAIGALAIIQIPPTILLWIVFAFTAYFLASKIREMIAKKSHDKPRNSLAVGLVGLFSGFLQGSGLAGSDLRNSYLYGQGLKIQEVHGTTAVMGALNFFIATVIRLATHQVAFPTLGQWLLIFVPFIIATTWIGKKILLKVPKKYSDVIVLIVMIVITGTLLWKLVS